MTEEQAWQYGLTALATILSVVTLLLCFRSLRRKRLIENVPTSKVAGVFIGLTEVKGEAELEPPLRSYLADCPSAWYAYDIQEQWRKTETYTDSKGHTRTRTSTGWTTVKSADIRHPFFLRDPTGKIQIRPEKADIEGDTVFDRTCGTSDPIYYGKGPGGSIAHSTHRRHFKERAIRVRRPIYTIGTARLREDVVEPEIAHGAEDEMFLISVNSEEAILASYARWGAFQAIFGGILLNAAPVIWFGFVSPSVEAALTPAAPFMVLGSVAYSLALFVYYLFLLYNGLVSVRNRLRMAWSQIEIQLKRRHDLIPGLVACVKGYVAHEKEVLGKLAEIRVEGAEDRAKAADEQTHALAGIFAVIERYPKIKADERFRKLGEELSRTETRIALAREFFNESVTALNNRIETLPDALVAPIGGFKKAEWFKIEEFEKHPVPASLPDEKKGETAIPVRESATAEPRPPKSERGEARIP